MQCHLKHLVRQKNACLCHDSAALTSHFPASRSPTRESVLSKTRVLGPTVPDAAQLGESIARHPLDDSRLRDTAPARC